MTTKKDLYQHIHDLEAEIDLWTTELEYLHGILSWMDLWDDFINKNLDDVRIKCAFLGFISEEISGFPEGMPGLVGTVATGQGIKYIAYSNDAALQKNLIAGNAVWITRTVELFMVLEYKIGNMCPFLRPVDL